MVRPKVSNLSICISLSSVPAEANGKETLLYSPPKSVTPQYLYNHEEAKE